MTDPRAQELLHTPEGLWDHYGKDIGEYRTTASRIAEQMHLFGFEDIRTPTFEFFDVFSKEIGTTPSRELYKFFDKDGNTLVLRPDFTPSVARCAAKYFMDEKKPLRFCYEGSSFINTSNLQGKLKEFTQTGAEYIGDDSAQADAEILALLISSLKAAGLEQFQVAVGNVEYFKGICDAAGIDEQSEKNLREYISGKNYYAASDLLEQIGTEGRYRDQFLKITDYVNSPEELRAVLSEAPNARAAGAIQRLIDIREILEIYGVVDYVSFDLSLLSKYQYYTGVIFKGYTYGIGDAAASGGRYDRLLSHFGKDTPAIGFMIQIDMLLEALRAQRIPIPTSQKPAKLYYSQADYPEVLRQAMHRRLQGEAVALELSGDSNAAK